MLFCIPFFYFFSSGWQNEHALWHLRYVYVSRLFPHFSSPGLGGRSFLLRHFLKVFWTNNLLRTKQNKTWFRRKKFVSQQAPSVLCCVLLCTAGACGRTTHRFTDTICTPVSTRSVCCFPFSFPMIHCSPSCGGQLNIVTELERVGYLERCENSQSPIVRMGRTGSDPHRVLWERFKKTRCFLSLQFLFFFFSYSDKQRNLNRAAASWVNMSNMKISQFTTKVPK